MISRSPSETISRLVEAINRGNLEAALAVYEPEAVLVVRPGQVATGTAALRSALAGFIALKPTLKPEENRVIESGDVALYCSRWSLQGIDQHGREVWMNGRSSDVLRRQPDGNWLIAIDNPWGPDILDG
jgi:Ketosteroid isomerase homolog